MFTGLYTALITPFKNNKIDEDALKKLVEFQIENGVDGIIPCGTTGESPTLNHEEHNKVVEICVKASNGRAKIIAGSGSNSTREAIMLTNHAKEIGADGCLIVAPYYNKPTQEGLFKHFEEINKCDLPFIIYNIPGRSSVDIKDETLARISELENAAGIKDATGDLGRIFSLRQLVKRTGFSFLSGEDPTTVGFNALGGNGVISVTSNIAPALCKEVQNACKNGDYKKALEIHDKLAPLHRSMFLETNPIPVKYGAHLVGLCENEVRMPLTEPSENVKREVENALKALKLI